MEGLDIINKKEINITSDSIESVVSKLNENRKFLYNVPIQAIILILDRFSKSLITNDEIAYIEGMPYLARWLKKKNIENIIENDIGNSRKLDGFINHNNYKLIAQPRGIVSHWLANNVQLLPIYSLFLSVLCKNANILKIAQESAQLMNTLMKELAKVNIIYEKSSYSGKIITDTVVFCSFSSKNHEISNKLSQSSDFRIVWGGDDAVKGVLSLPVKTHSDTIIFGPKYSFCIFDKESIEDDNFSETISNTINDIILFNQAACSSPHVCFFEKNSNSNSIGIENIIDTFKKGFQQLNNKKLNKLPQELCANVLNARAQYLLDPNLKINSSDDLSWTILINDSLELEDPVNGRTIFIKQINDIESIKTIVTRKVQCISLMMKNSEKKERIAKKLSYLGIDRICEVGKMHEFTIPWDGIFPLNRLVRWVSLR